MIGVWATASRRKSRMWDTNWARTSAHGPWEQVSRLGEPAVQRGASCRWPRRTSGTPGRRSGDARYTKYVNKPELAGLLPVLYPGVFPNLAAYNKPRADLNAILITGIPEGVVPGFQNFTGPVQADLLRLNVAIPPASSPNNLGLVAGDAAGFPNGRRIDDDVVTIELRAVAGLTIPLVDPTYTPDGAASAVTGRDDEHQRGARLATFPYLGLPGGGYQTVPGTTQAS